MKKQHIIMKELNKFENGNYEGTRKVDLDVIKAKKAQMRILS